jgi:hypothetical protein
MDNRLLSFFAAIGVFVCICFIAYLTLHTISGFQEKQQQKYVIDSLQQEILLRDNLINQSKDTTYGEEKAITNINE